MFNVKCKLCLSIDTAVTKLIVYTLFWNSRVHDVHANMKKGVFNFFSPLPNYSSVLDVTLVSTMLKQWLQHREFVVPYTVTGRKAKVTAYTLQWNSFFCRILDFIEFLSSKDMKYISLLESNSSLIACSKHKSKYNYFTVIHH